MSRLLTFCLLIVPLAHGLVVLPETAPSLTVVKTHREVEEEVYNNITSLSNKAMFIPPVTPTENGELPPLHVKVNSYIRNIQIKNVDTDLYEWTADLTFRQMWNDRRLAYDVSDHPDFKYIPLVNPSAVKSIWKPDTFFTTALKGDFHFVLAPNVLVWVYPNGDVVYSIRITVSMLCHPTNTASETEGETVKEGEFVCPMRVASYGYTNDKVVYEWDEETPVHLKKDLYMPHFTVSKVTTEPDNGMTKIGTFSAITANFHFTHK